MTKNIKPLPIPSQGTRFLEAVYREGRQISQRTIEFKEVDEDLYLRFAVVGDPRTHVNLSPSAWVEEWESEVNPGTVYKTTYTELIPQKHAAEKTGAAA